MTGANGAAGEAKTEPHSSGILEPDDFFLIFFMQADDKRAYGE